MRRSGSTRRLAVLAITMLVLVSCSGSDDAPSTSGGVTTPEPSMNGTSAPAAPVPTPAEASSDESIPVAEQSESTSVPTAESTTTELTTTTVAPVIATVPEADSVLAIINARDDLTIFARLAATIDSPTVFQQGRGVTILAPTDAAWTATFDEEQIEAILADRDAAALWLSEHLAVGSRTSADLLAEGVFRNAMTRSLVVEDRAGDIYVGEARIESSDISADNGVVHVVNAVLLPPFE